MKSECEIDQYGTKYWYNDQSLLHREDGLAIEYTDGNKRWFINGKRHREDGPAVEYPNGDKEWWIEGKRHRKDGPAIDLKTTKYWWINGKLHREDGPAFEETNGNKVWFYHGKHIKVSSQEEFKRFLKLRMFW